MDSNISKSPHTAQHHSLSHLVAYSLVGKNSLNQTTPQQTNHTMPALNATTFGSQGSSFNNTPQSSGVPVLNPMPPGSAAMKVTSFEQAYRQKLKEKINDSVSLSIQNQQQQQKIFNMQEVNRMSPNQTMNAAIFPQSALLAMDLSSKRLTPSNSSVANQPQHTYASIAAGARLSTHDMGLERPFKTEDSVHISRNDQVSTITQQKNDSSNQQIDSIFERISNLRRTLKQTVPAPSESSHIKREDSSRLSQNQDYSRLSMVQNDQISQNNNSMAQRSERQVVNQTQGSFRSQNNVLSPPTDVYRQYTNTGLTNEEHHQPNINSSQIISGSQSVIIQESLQNTQQNPLHYQSLPPTSHQQDQFGKIVNTPAFSLEHRQSIQDLEDRVKGEMDRKYQSRLSELEKRSLYLDKTLEIIEEMKQKFFNYEQQQSDYNSLLLKYNQLLYQTSQNPSQDHFNKGSISTNNPYSDNLYQNNQQIGGSLSYLNSNDTNQHFPPSHLQWQSIPQQNNVNSQEDTRTTPLVNFQISTMGDDDVSQSERGASIHLQKVQQSVETLDQHQKALDTQIQSTLVALEQQSQSLMEALPPGQQSLINYQRSQSPPERDTKGCTLSQQESVQMQHKYSNADLVEDRVKPVSRAINRFSNTQGQKPKQNPSRSNSKENHQPLQRNSSQKQNPRAFVKSPPPPSQGRLSVGYVSTNSGQKFGMYQQIKTANKGSAKRLPFQEQQIHHQTSVERKTTTGFSPSRFVAGRSQDKSENENINLELEAFSKQTFAELHKKIDLLETQKKALKEKLKTQTTQQCCCADLKLQHEEREKALTQLAEHWRGKTQLLVAKYYKALQVIREDQNKIRGITVEAIQQMRNMQDKVITSILKKQRETQVYYEKKLKKQDKELKEAKKRLIAVRYAQLNSGKGQEMQAPPR
ncbi:hypothetical protein FGO68_gene15376 [Halteria grandinella]|uniref:Uncharacterized protein n=1 Tax=Halteria grandinella TaxID=5974 RepID=A0A8J8T693_HALGN|nr:hypothetical protein FGO68_gene15376 [Halteria grandinella]